MKLKHVCHNCKNPFTRVHRWKRVHRHFLFFHWSYRVHHDCAHPMEGPPKPRLKAEVPLPFPGPMEPVDPRSVYPPVTVR